MNALTCAAIARGASAAMLGLLLVCSAVRADPDTVTVKYRGPLDLGHLQCEWVTRSSLVRRLCYDARQSYVVVNLNGTYYHYCGVPAGVVSAWRGADSMGRFYNASIKGRYDCRLATVPEYGD
jgi:hypothetical protein